MLRRSGLTAAFLAAPVAARAWQADTVSNVPFQAYSIIQYATTAGRSPQSVLRLDDNGDLVLAARRGIRRAERRRTMAVTES